MKTPLQWTWIMGLLGVGFTLPAWAQDARLANQALHCSVLMDLLAQAPNTDPETGTRLLRASRLFSELHVRESGRLGTQAPHDTAPAEQTARNELWATLHQQAATFREHAVVCGAWAEGFLAQGTQPQFVPVYPKIVAASVRVQYDMLARKLTPAP